MNTGQMDNQDPRNIVFFDGVCNLCNNGVNWIWKHNKSEDLYFSSLQSDFASKFFADTPYHIQNLDTVYFYEGGRFYQRSEAILRIMTHFSGGYRRLARWLLKVPTFISDGFYRLIAATRYQFFGAKDHCRIPTEEEKSRFLES